MESHSLRRAPATPLEQFQLAEPALKPFAPPAEGLVDRLGRGRATPLEVLFTVGRGISQTVTWTRWAERSRVPDANIEGDGMGEAGTRRYYTRSRKLARGH